MDILPEVLILSDSGSSSCSCAIYDLKTGNLLSKFKGGNSARHGVALIGDHYIISSIAGHPSLKVWTLNSSGTNENQMTVPGVVSCLAVTNDGLYCIAGIENYIYMWEVMSGTLLACLQYHSKIVTCIKVSSDGSHFVSGSADGMVLVWLLSEATGSSDFPEKVRPRYTWMDHSGEITDIFVGGIATYARVATASKDMTCRIHELETGLLLLTVRVDYAISAITMDELEFFLLLGSAHGDIYRINLFSANNAELQYEKADKTVACIGHKAEITSLSVSMSGKFLASGSQDFECRIWDLASLSCVKTIKCPGGITNAFITLYPSGLDNETFAPPMCVTAFKRHFTKNTYDATVSSILHPKELSMIHHGVPDQHFDSRLLTNSTGTTESFNQNGATVKDVTAINTQMYSFALNDEISEISEDSESAGEEDLLEDLGSD